MAGGCILVVMRRCLLLENDPATMLGNLPFPTCEHRSSGMKESPQPTGEGYKPVRDSMARRARRWDVHRSSSLAQRHTRSETSERVICAPTLI